MQISFWKTLSFGLGTAAVAALLAPYFQGPPVALTEEPQEAGRWESEGGNVPGANLSIQQTEREHPSKAA